MAVRTGSRPHLVETFKVSRHRLRRQVNVVVLYLNRPTKRWFLCVDEKSCKGQASIAPGPGFPMKKGRAGTHTHDYKRNGTALFAALNMLDGTVIGTACRAIDIASFCASQADRSARPPPIST